MRVNFKVDPAELRTAAAKARALVSPIQCRNSAPVNANGEAFGHIELAAYFVDFCDDLGVALTAAAGRTSAMARHLDDTALDYEATDLFTRDLLNGLRVSPRPGDPGFVGPVAR